MRTPVPEKLLKLADDIAQHGAVPVTRLTVLKKWFERRDRLSAFAVWVALRAISRKGKAAKKAADLFREARTLMKGLDGLRPMIAEAKRDDARDLLRRLRAFQDIYRATHWGQVRTIDNWQLFLVEQGLAILLNQFASPTVGYKLAADYCRHYDPRYSDGLNGPSKGKLLEIVRFMNGVEALEPDEGDPARGLRQRLSSSRTPTAMGRPISEPSSSTTSTM
jgi:hypothetical protein